MFWNSISPVYDLFENVYNGRVYTDTGRRVAEFIDRRDDVLECACGTGAITESIAPACKSLIATDFAEGMLKRAAEKCARFDNVTFQTADIADTGFDDASFDKVVAGNVIHLLPEPDRALLELERVVRPGGTLIIPTYISATEKADRGVVRFLELLGADFKGRFDLASYKRFFDDLGYRDALYTVVDGRISCAIAVIKV